MIFSRYFLLMLLMWGVCRVKAQEFLANVTINTPKLQVADPKIFKSLKNALTEFINNRKWSNDEYTQEEKIDLNIVLTIEKENSATSFSGQITVQATRPVYNSGYNTIIFQHLDKDFTFSYGEFEVLDFTENAFTSNLTSVVGFYAYVVLGLNYDSFSELGGEDYLQKALTILNNVPSGAGAGWKMADATSVVNRSRYWLIENLLNVRVQPMRRAFYQYYLLGLDLLSKSDTRPQGLSNVLKALEAIQKVNDQYPASMIIQTFTTMKRDELAQLFLVSDVATKRKAYDLLIKLDGAKADTYKDLLK